VLSGSANRPTPARLLIRVLRTGLDLQPEAPKEAEEGN
jgi:hypothetical protein